MDTFTQAGNEAAVKGKFLKVLVQGERLEVGVVLIIKLGEDLLKPVDWVGWAATSSLGFEVLLSGRINSLLSLYQHSD